MGMTLAQKMLATAVGRDSVAVGEILEVEPDLVLTHDHQGPMTIREFEEFGQEKVWDPTKLMMSMDHRTPSQTFLAATNHRIMREFCTAQGIDKLYDVGAGICHDVVAEERMATPGQIVVGTDSHTTTAGALCTFATGVGSSEMATIWVRGRTWFKVPESIKVTFKGRLKPLVNAKDIVLHLLGMMNTDGATYRSIEYHCEHPDTLHMEQRLTLSNMSLEIGAKVGLFAVDDVTRAYYADVGITDIPDIQPDPDAEYVLEYEVDLDQLDCMVAKPNSPGNVGSAKSVEDTWKIDQAIIGTCTNGRITDLRAAAKVMEGQKVHPDVRFIIVPATQLINQQAHEEGLINTFIQAGAMVGVPGCGPCGAYGVGAMADGETCITTGSRNFVGRLGSTKCNTFLGSAETVAASAIAGRVIDPNDLANALKDMEVA